MPLRWMIFLKNQLSQMVPKSWNQLMKSWIKWKKQLSLRISRQKTRANKPQLQKRLPQPVPKMALFMKPLKKMLHFLAEMSIATNGWLNIYNIRPLQPNRAYKAGYLYNLS